MGASRTVPLAKVVYKDHEQDGQPAQGVHGDYARPRLRLAGTCRTFVMELCQDGFHRGVVNCSCSWAIVVFGSLIMGTVATDRTCACTVDPDWIRGACATRGER